MRTVRDSWNIHYLTPPFTRSLSLHRSISLAMHVTHNFHSILADVKFFQIFSANFSVWREKRQTTWMMFIPHIVMLFPLSLMVQIKSKLKINLWLNIYEIFLSCLPVSVIEKSNSKCERESIFWHERIYHSLLGLSFFRHLTMYKTFTYIFSSL